MEQEEKRHRYALEKQQSQVSVVIEGNGWKATFSGHKDAVKEMAMHAQQAIQPKDKSKDKDKVFHHGQSKMVGYK